MRIVGIDPGLSGGAFYYDTDMEKTNEELCWPNLPEFEGYRFKVQNSVIDINDFYNWLTAMNPDLIFLEKIFLTGKEGGQSAMTIGSNYGRLAAALEFSGYDWNEVAPKVWQRSLALKGGSRAIIKESAKNLAVQRFGIKTFLSGKERKPHDGLTDAACIALYGVKVWTENQSTKSTQSSAQSMETSAKRFSTSKKKSKKLKKPSKSKSTKQSKPLQKPVGRSAKSSTKSKRAGKN
jgi:Holliday junction resolvasome RuvABC endonuclease subunit